MLCHKFLGHYITFFLRSCEVGRDFKKHSYVQQNMLIVVPYQSIHKIRVPTELRPFEGCTEELRFGNPRPIP